MCGKNLCVYVCACAHYLHIDTCAPIEHASSELFSRMHASYSDYRLLFFDFAVHTHIHVI